MAAISSTLKLHDSMSSTLRSINSAMSSTLAAMRSIKGAEIGAEFAQAAADVKLAENAIDQMNRELQEVPSATQKSSDGFTLMKGIAVNALTAIGGYIKNSVRDVISLTDQLTSSAARLGLMAGEGESVASIQEDIFAAAQRSHTEYLEMADTVGKLKLLSGDAFSSTQEAVLFAEQLSKQFAIAGTDITAATGATRQLVQALGSGVLRGDELNSVFEAAPTIIQSIADYMQVPIGSIRDMASEGRLTADIIKRAMFASAEATNAKFKAMPMTIGQIWQVASNNILKAAQPMLEALAEGARFIYDNWSVIGPILAGVATGILAIAAALAVHAVNTWLSVAANKAFVDSLLTNPFIAIAVIIAIIIAKIAEWVEAVGGMEVAWLIVSDAIISGWDWFLNKIQAGVYFFLNAWDNMGIGMAKIGNGIVDFIGGVRVAILKILQNMANGAIDIVNQIIDALNTLPEVSITPVGGGVSIDTGGAPGKVPIETGNPFLDAVNQAWDQAAIDATTTLPDVPEAEYPYDYRIIEGLDPLEHVDEQIFTFAEEAEAEAAAAGAIRDAAIAQREAELAATRRERETDIYGRELMSGVNHALRQAEINRRQEEIRLAQEAAGGDATAATLEETLAMMPEEAYDPNKDPINNVTSGSGSNASLRTTGEVNISGEDIKMLLDLATQDYRLEYQQITPEIILQGVTIHESADMETVMNVVAEHVYEIANGDLRVPV